ncbi:MAG: MFS transporter [Liquorilactobacillus nagelii]|uniref:MFS transporter n=1 Tax=Liquorilactobacillus nagelii TaxID=82688 RepID=UPI0039EA99B7
MSKNINPFLVTDQSKLGKFHVKAMLITGMGVLSDGYGLSSVAVILPIILTSLGGEVTGLTTSFLSAAPLMGMIVGSLLFGYLGNSGRKKYYGIDVILMTVATLLSAMSTNIVFLIITRFFFGIGAGADYVLSPTILGEHCNAKDRGKLMSAGFGLSWTMGAIFAVLVAMTCSALGLSGELTWRITLGMGALPAASVIYLRRHLPETPRFLARVQGNNQEAAEVVAAETKQATTKLDVQQDHQSVQDYLQKEKAAIIKASLLWFLADIAGYSTELYGPSLIAKGLGLSSTSFSLLTHVLFSVPSAILAVFLIDSLGRNKLQALGAFLAGCALIGFSLLGTSGIMGQFIMFGAFSFFDNLGPGSVVQAGITGIEIASTKARSIVQAITVTAGRCGAILTAFVFPSLFKYFGETVSMWFLIAILFILTVASIVLLPEAKNRSLEDCAQEVIGQEGSIGQPL